MQILSKAALMAATVALSGCAGSLTYDPDKLAWPSPRLMKEPRDVPPVPDDEGNPAVRALFLTKTLSQCSATADQVRGLQDYARAIHAKPKGSS